MKPAKKKRLKIWIVPVTILVLLAAGFGAYQFWFSQPSQEDIDAAMTSKDWKRVTNLLERTDLSEDGGENYFSMALAYSNLGDKTQAIDAYMLADNKGFRRSMSRYEIACLYAELGEDELAIEWLRDAYDSGFSNEDLVKRDKRLDSLRSKKEFKQVLDPLPFEESIELGGLDFLLGTWSANVATNQVTTVTYTELVKGRVIGETWIGAGAGTSSGVFVLDPETERWTYSYVDSLGRFYKGNVQVRKQIVTITGTITYTHGADIARKIDIRTAVDLIDYETSDSADGGVTYYAPQRIRFSPSTSTTKPSF